MESLLHQGAKFKFKLKLSSLSQVSANFKSEALSTASLDQVLQVWSLDVLLL